MWLDEGLGVRVHEVYAHSDGSLHLLALCFTGSEFALLISVSCIGRIQERFPASIEALRSLGGMKV